MAKNIEFLFYPGSIAVVGVSEDVHKLGSIFFNNLIDAGFKGNLFPVNPKHEELYGYKCYPNVSAIPDPVDQVAILIPAPFVMDVLRDAASKGVKTALIISAGFGETGAAGKDLERQMVEISNTSGMRILGPNIIGVINTVNKLNSSWMQLFPEEGNLAFLSQSGAFCTAVLDMAISERLGFYNFCSIGNKIDINELDLINYWYQDNNVKVIGAYLEEIGSGFDLLKYINTSEVCKPIILFKPGKTNAAVKAITSHTGSMAGSVETVEAAIKQSGLIEVNSTLEFLSDFMTFSWSKQPGGNRVAVITNAGGPGIMATDTIVQNGMQMADLSPETQDALKKVLPAAASVHNPVDILGDALAERYLEATNIVIQDPGVDILLFIVTPQYITQIEDTAKMLIRLRKATNKPIFTVFLGEKYVSIGLERMQDAQVPVYNDILIGIMAIADLVKHGNHLRTRQIQPARDKYIFIEQNLNKGQYQNEVNQCLKEGEQVTLPDELIAKIAQEIGFDSPKQILAKDLEEAKQFAQLNYPVVIKAPNQLIAHKTDFKAVYIDIKDENSLVEAYNELKQTIAQNTAEATPEILVQEMIQYQEEVFIGATRDGASDVYTGGKKGFGHLIVTGTGGIYTEVYKDVSHVLVPAGKDEIISAFNATKISQIVKGVRGQAPLAFDKVIETIELVQKLVIMYPQIVSLDINPVLLNDQRAVAVDLKIFVQR